MNLFCSFNIEIDLFVCVFLFTDTGTAGPGMIITLHADLDLFQDQFHHPLMREIIGQTRSPQGIPDPFQGLFLHARRGITGQTTGPQAREGMVVVPVYDEPSRSPSPRGNGRSPSRSHSRSYRYVPFSLSFCLDGKYEIHDLSGSGAVVYP